MSDFWGRGTPGEGAPLIIRIFPNNVYLLRGQFILKNLTLCLRTQFVTFMKVFRAPKMTPKTHEK